MRCRCRQKKPEPCCVNPPKQARRCMHSFATGIRFCFLGFMDPPTLLPAMVSGSNCQRACQRCYHVAKIEPDSLVPKNSKKRGIIGHFVLGFDRLNKLPFHCWTILSDCSIFRTISRPHQVRKIGPRLCTHTSI